MRNEHKLEYDKLNMKQFKFACCKNTEQDMIEWLDEKPNKSGYIKKLIRDDMNN